MRIGVYAGTFDPPTFGHVSVIRRASELFDCLWIVVADNPEKKPLLTKEERVSLLREETRTMNNVKVASTEGFVVQFAGAVGARFLIRGVRGVTDIESEMALANLNHEVAPEIETVFLPAHPELSKVSSSALKEMMMRGEDVHAFCSPSVAAKMHAKLKLSGTGVPHVTV